MPDEVEVRGLLDGCTHGVRRKRALCGGLLFFTFVSETFFWRLEMGMVV